MLQQFRLKSTPPPRAIPTRRSSDIIAKALFFFLTEKKNAEKKERKSGRTLFFSALRSQHNLGGAATPCPSNANFSAGTYHACPLYPPSSLSRGRSKRSSSSRLPRPNKASEFPHHSNPPLTYICRSTYYISCPPRPPAPVEELPNPLQPPSIPCTPANTDMHCP